MGAGEIDAVISLQPGRVRQIGPGIGRKAEIGHHVAIDGGDLRSIGLAHAHPVIAGMGGALIGGVAVDDEDAERAGGDLKHDVRTAGVGCALHLT